MSASFRVGVLVVMLAATAGVRAEFVNGVESFNGTTKDLVAWEERLDTLFQPGWITQNNQLDVRNGEFTTRTRRVMIGQGVRVKMARLTFLNENSITEHGSAEVYLASNVTGPSVYPHDDSRVLYISSSYRQSFNEQEFVMVHDGHNSPRTNDLLYVATGNHSGEMYTAGIDLLDAFHARYTLWNGAGTQLSSRTLTLPANDPLPAGLFITLYATRGNYDDVTIVPEPSSAAALAVAFASMTLLRRRRRRRRRGLPDLRLRPPRHARPLPGVRCRAGTLDGTAE